MISEIIIRMKELVGITGLSKSTLYRLEKKGGFPARLRLSENAVGWREKEVVEWVDSRKTANAI